MDKWHLEQYRRLTANKNTGFKLLYNSLVSVKASMENKMVITPRYLT